MDFWIFGIDFKGIMLLLDKNYIYIIFVYLSEEKMII